MTKNKMTTTKCNVLKGIFLCGYTYITHVLHMYTQKINNPMPICRIREHSFFSKLCETSDVLVT